MDTVTLLFVRKKWWHLGSTLIRWALPVSRFQWARASHSIIAHNGWAYHATARHGVVKTVAQEAMHGNILVCIKEFEVPDLAAGLLWIERQIGKPYDYKGALGVAIKPDRLWAEEDKWFCHELCAAMLHACGRHLFTETGYVTDSHLIIANTGVPKNGAK